MAKRLPEDGQRERREAAEARASRRRDEAVR
jgi:hypothetical protein